MRKGIAIAGILTLTSGLVLVAWLFPAFDFLKSYRERLSLEYPYKLSPRREMRIEEAQLNVRYYPRESFASTIILVPGLHPFGIDDPRFVAFAEVVAQAGFNVIAPDILELRNFSLTSRSVEQLVELIKALPRHVPEDSLRNLGMAGISFGAGPVFLAASDPEVKSRLHFLVSIGGYANLPRALSFAIEGVDPWGRMIMAANHIDKIVDEPDASILKESIRLRLHLKEKAAELKEEALSGNGRKLLGEILAGLSKQNLELFKKILQRKESLFLPLSPEKILGDLNPQIRIYLLHGRSDALIPYQETLELKKGLEEKGHRRLHTLIAESFTHVEISKNESGLLDTLKLLLWTRAFLNERDVK